MAIGADFLVDILVYLRRTLTDFERNYQIKILSKQIPCKAKFMSFSIAIPKLDLLNPYFITGFSDAESCFSVGIYQNSKIQIG